MAESGDQRQRLSKKERDESEPTEFINTFDQSPMPTQCDAAWIFLRVNMDQEEQQGRWLIFRPFDQLDDTWKAVCSAAATGALRRCMIYAKCSTVFYNPRCTGPGPITSGVISVITTAHYKEEAGRALINIVKHDIKYKNTRTPAQFAWNRREDRELCETLYWNDGRPLNVMITECTGPSCVISPDVWHLNVAKSPQELENPYGCWTVGIHCNSSCKLTAIWQYLRRLIIGGELGQVEMICPAIVAEGRVERIEYKLYTAHENREMVGRKIAEKASLLEEKNIQIVYRESIDPATHSIEWDEDNHGFIYTIKLKI